MGIFDFLKKKPVEAHHEELDLPPEPPKLGGHADAPPLPINEELHPHVSPKHAKKHHAPTLHPPIHPPPSHKSKGKPKF